MFGFYSNFGHIIIFTFKFCWLCKLKMAPSTPMWLIWMGDGNEHHLHLFRCHCGPPVVIRVGSQRSYENRFCPSRLQYTRDHFSMTGTSNVYLKSPVVQFLLLLLFFKATIDAMLSSPYTKTDFLLVWFHPWHTKKCPIPSNIIRKII